jgi:hypothetical protein
MGQGGSRRYDVQILTEDPPRAQAAEDERLRLLADINKIEGQLADRERIDPETGERMDARRYFRWRHSAVVARTKLLEQYRAVKAELKAAAVNEGNPGNRGRRSLVNEIIAAAQGWYEDRTADTESRLYLAVGTFQAFITEGDDDDRD